MLKPWYKPVSMLVSLAGGMLAGTRSLTGTRPGENSGAEQGKKSRR